LSISTLDVRQGAQLPRLANVPKGVSSDGPDASELAAFCGLILDPWQKYALECLLQRRADGRWRTKTGLLVVPRQNGKGAVIEAWELFRLFVLNVREVRHTAHHAKTAKDAFEKMRFRVKGSALLDDRLARDRSGGIRTANGEWGFTFKSGQKLTYTTRTEGIGRGETLSDIVVDEAQHLSDAEMGAISFTMATKPMGQTLLTGSAPIPTKSEVMTRLISAGRDGSDGMTYLEWSIDESLQVDLDDRELWAEANPGYGIRLLDEEICNERIQNSPDVFARERLGIVAVGPGGAFPAGVWKALADARSAPSGTVTYGLAVADDRTWACVGAAGASPAGFCHVEYGAYRASTAWVVDYLTDLASRRKVRVVVRPGSQAGSLIPALEALRVDVVKASQQDYAAACGDFRDSVVSRRDLRHLGQPALDVAVSAAQSRRTGDSTVWEQRNPATDISPLEAVTLAAWGFRHKQARPGRFVSF
jgi:phage terminase large subunit-like protein